MRFYIDVGALPHEFRMSTKFSAAKILTMLIETFTHKLLLKSCERSTHSTFCATIETITSEHVSQNNLASRFYYYNAYVRKNRLSTKNSEKCRAVFKKNFLVVNKIKIAVSNS